MNSVSIIGAGIGGLTLANVLKQQGISCVLYESAPEIKPVGSGIMMAVNAMQVFERLGLKEKIEQAGNKIHGISVTDKNFRMISKTDVLGLESKYRSCNVAIHRADLQRILAESFGFENIRLNHSLQSIERNGNYFLDFSNGEQVETEVVFGADGIKSKTRDLIFQTGRIRSAGQKCWRGLALIDLPEKYEHEAFEIWGKGKRFGFVRMTAKKVYWYAVVNEEKYCPEKAVLSYFADFRSPVAQIIEATLPEDLIFNDLADLSPLPEWHTDHLCLIGDAAHATTPNMGQGAGQAIEDAYVIGKLRKQDEDWNTVFQKFQNIRRPKVDYVVGTSRRIGVVSQWERGTAIRNFLMRRMPESLSRKMIEKVFKLEI